VAQTLPLLHHARAALKPPRIVPVAPPAMVLVLLGAGLRIEELCKLDCADLVGATSADPKTPAVLRIRGKRGKQRSVPLLSPVVHGLLAYLAATGRTPAAEGALFLAHDALTRARSERRRIGVRSTRKRISRLFRKQGIPPAICVHGRHTFSTAVIANGGTLKDLAELLGHSSLVTTARYVSRLGADVGGLLGCMPLALLRG
jgi:site-specific recombinase XerD